MPDSALTVKPATLSVHKSKDGVYRWVLTSSNSYEDRDKEIVSQAALERDVERADAQQDYGPLVWWHLNGRVNPSTGEKSALLKLGDCDFNMMHGHVLVEAGTFDDWRFAEALQVHEKELAVSIGFNFPDSEPDADGVFHNIQRYERSLLPREFASNPFTSFEIANKESSMTTQAEKVAKFAEFMHVDEATGLKMLAAAERAEQSAVAANARHKAQGGRKAADDEMAAGAPKSEDPDRSALEAVDATLTELVDKVDALVTATETEATDDSKPELETEKDDTDMETWRSTVDAALTALVAKVDALSTATAEKAVSEKAVLSALKETADKAWQLAQELNGSLPRRLGDPLASYRASQQGAPVREALKSAGAEIANAAPASGFDKHFTALGLGTAHAIPAIPAPPTPG